MDAWKNRRLEAKYVKNGKKNLPVFLLNRSTIQPLNPSTVILILIKYIEYEQTRV